MAALPRCLHRAQNYALLFGGNLLSLLATVLAIGGIALAVFLLRGRWGTAVRGEPVGFVLAAPLSALAVSIPYLASQGDTEVFDALRVTIWYSICTVIPQIVAGLLLAVLLTRQIRGKQAFRVIYLLPYIAPTVATAAVFELLFSLRPDSFANQVLGLLGVGPLELPSGASRDIPALCRPGSHRQCTPGSAVVQTYWAGRVVGAQPGARGDRALQLVGFCRYAPLLYLHQRAERHPTPALRGRASGRRRGGSRSFFSITLPLLSPTTYFLSLLGVIGTFKAFTHLYVLRSAAASVTVDPLSVTIFFTAFRKGNMGYASAVSILLFILVLGLSIAQQRSTESAVTYGD